MPGSNWNLNEPRLRPNGPAGFFIARSPLSPEFYNHRLTPKGRCAMSTKHNEFSKETMSKRRKGFQF